MGQPITMTYTDTNTSDQTITRFADSQPAAFNIWHNGAPERLIAYPQFVSANPKTFAPGQTQSYSDTLYAIPDQGPDNLANLTGTFFATYGPQNDQAQLTAEFQIAAPSSWDVVTSITTDQSVYQAGQPVTMTFTETNEGDQPIAVVTGATSIQVTQNGNLVQGFPFSVSTSWTTLQPGQSLTQAQTWNTNSEDSGTYVVSDLLDPNGSTATFQIVGASAGSSSHVEATAGVTATVSTDQTSYKLGQSVHIALALEDGAQDQGGPIVDQGPRAHHGDGGIDGNLANVSPGAECCTQDPRAGQERQAHHGVERPVESAWRAHCHARYLHDRRRLWRLSRRGDH